MTDNNMFSLEIAKSLVESNNQFPVEFDLAWQWLEYSRKDNAKSSLIENFIEELDFLIVKELGSLAVPRPKEKILLTIDCFKAWSMMANTTKGREVRLYFLECEKIAKSKTSFQLPTTFAEALQLAADQAKALEEAVKQQALLEAQNTKLDKINNILVDKIEEDKPKVEFANDVWVSERSLSMGEYAKVINWGRNKLFAKLREIGVIMPKSTLPYQKYISSGYFEVTEVVKENIGVIPLCKVTPKGQLWVHKKLA